MLRPSLPAGGFLVLVFRGWVDSTAHGSVCSFGKSLQRHHWGSIPRPSYYQRSGLTTTLPQARFHRSYKDKRRRWLCGNASEFCQGGKLKFCCFPSVSFDKYRDAFNYIEAVYFFISLSAQFITTRLAIEEVRVSVLLRFLENSGGNPGAESGCPSGFLWFWPHLPDICRDVTSNSAEPFFGAVSSYWSWHWVLSG